MLAILFPIAVLVAFLGLCAVALPDVPRITGTVAFIVTIAALGVAILR
ncbi:hypothetical protein [Streptomyces sp. NPDC051684]